MTVVAMDLADESGEGRAEQLVWELADRARVRRVDVDRGGWVLARLTKVMVESALKGEMDDHLGYGKHDPAGRNGGNS